MKIRSLFLSILLPSVPLVAALDYKTPDLDKDKTLYVVGYAHLDTQWRWDYAKTIDTYIKETLDGNIDLLERYPDYVFNFTGSSRYEMMAEYYPEQFEKVKKFIEQGRWFVSGSSVDECDVLIPSPESVLRHILYGNQYFRNQFNKESVDFMLPDCFGFPAYLPSLWAHCGIKGFSTQKLTWGSVMGIPFNVGVWEGPDGNSVIGALNATNYTGSMPERQDIDKDWVRRMENNADGTGVYADYRYYGVGDMGGGLRESDVQKAVASLNNPDSELNVVLSSSDRLYKDITPEQKARLRRFNGELMLTEHSAGVATSKTYMKRLNRKNELLADAAERAAVMSEWMGATEYPIQTLRDSWKRVLVSQMHDIIPGTSLQRAYQYSWNDELIAANNFASIETNAIAGVARALDTRVKGEAIVLYNPLAFARQDVVTATVSFPNGTPENVRVYNEQGKEVPSQLVASEEGNITVLFLAELDSVATAVYDVRPSDKPCMTKSGLKIHGNTLENNYYRVALTEGGDIASVFDKAAGRELLSEPTRLEFHRSYPAMYPAWNMDWKDRSLPALDYVDTPAVIKVVENGPVRIAIEITRQDRNSIITQKVCLAAGDAGRRVEIHNDIDWQSKEVILKAAFPLTVSNSSATYTQQFGTVTRGNNNPKFYEYLSHMWFDLTDTTGDYGVSVLDDCKFGSDKPTDNILRLTLLYTPGTKPNNFYEQSAQDWGRNEFVYALYGHEGTWVKGLSEAQARRLNQPIAAFQAQQHKGKLGKSFSMLELNTQQVDVRAIKKSECGKYVVIRLQELFSNPVSDVIVSMGNGIVSGFEIDGQERKIGPAKIRDGKLHLDMNRNAMRSFALKLSDAPVALTRPMVKTVELPYDTTVFTADGQAVSAGFGPVKLSMPLELMPETITVDSVNFKMADKSADENALTCKGQTIKLPDGKYNRVYLLASADVDTGSIITIGQEPFDFSVQAWNGFIGQWDKTVWDREEREVDYDCAGWVVGMESGYIKRDQLAWFATHSHNADGSNRPYKFGYIFKYGYDLNGADTITLPDNPAIKVYAVSVANDSNYAVPACDLYDNFDDREPVSLRVREGAYDYGRTPLAQVKTQRAASYEELDLVKPVNNDLADVNTNADIAFVYVTDKYAVNDKHSVAGNKLEKLNDGKVPSGEDDPSMANFFDGGLGRFVVDLKKPVAISKINTFTCHVSERAQQKFSIWASNEKLSTDAGLSADANPAWTYIATVDTTLLGEGGVHASSAELPAGSEYQYIMFITSRAGYGTFFNEIDIVAQ